MSELQHFAGDFGWTAFRSLQFLEGFVASAPDFGIRARPQRRELRSLLFTKSAWVV